MTEAYRIIVVEDSATDAELEMHELRKAGFDIVPQVVETERDFRLAIEQFGADIIVSDYSLPHFDGMSALKIARETCPDVPFIFVSGTIGEEKAVGALQNGAMDYILKNNLTRFPAAVERAVREAREKRAREDTERALVSSQERFRSIVESTNEWIWEMDPNGRLIYSNPAVERILGYAPADLEGKAASTLLVPSEQPRYAENLARLREAPAAWQGTVFLWRHHDGTTRWLESNGMPVFDAAGRLAGFRGADRDITLRVQQETKLARLARIRELAGEVNAAITRHKDRNTLLQEICRIAVEVGRLRMAWAGHVDEAVRSVVPVAWHGGDSTFTAHFDLGLDGNEDAVSLAALAVRHGAPAVENDVALSSRTDEWRRKMLEYGFLSVIALPLKVAGDTVSVLALQSAEKDSFTPEEERLFVDLSADVSLALESIHKQEQLDYIAYFDPLTTLPNRTLFIDRLGQALEENRRAGNHLALAYLDIERMRTINDSLGRAAGDMVLREVGERLQRAFRHTAVSRIGMDGFAVALGGFSSPVAAGRRISEALLAPFSETFRINGEALKVTARFGVAVFPGNGDTPEQLLQNAETALLIAKKQGDFVLFYTSTLNADVTARLRMETELRLAIEKRQFVLYFQPKIDLESDRIAGLEALIRWQHPTEGLVPPGKFIPLLEETGLILQVGEWALQEAVATYTDWRARGLNAPRIAVNVSAIQFRQQSFVEDILKAASCTDPGHCGIELEITESMVMQDLDRIIAYLHRLRGAGIRIAIDDFGTGHSSLSYLARLPLDSLKIDRTFVSRLPDNEIDVAIVSAIVSLARALDLRVVAEGVETEMQARMLEKLGCDQAQGYLFGRPCPAEEIETMLRT